MPFVSVQLYIMYYTLNVLENLDFYQINIAYFVDKANPNYKCFILNILPGNACTEIIHGMYKLKLQYFQLNHDHKLYTSLYGFYLFIQFIWYETRYYAKNFKLINHAREPCSLITSRHHYYHHVYYF